MSIKAPSFLDPTTNYLDIEELNDHRGRIIENRRERKVDQTRY